MSIVYDARIVLRGLYRRPGMVVAIILTLALGIGANTAVFSLVDALMFRPLAVADSKQLVGIYSSTRQTPYGANSLALYRALSANASTLSGVAGHWITTLRLTEETDAPDVTAALVTDEYFTVLRASPALGRTILPSDPAGAGANPVVVLNATFWRRHFASDPSVLGKRLVLRGQPVTVIGVMPDNFRGTDLSSVPDLWMPASMLPVLDFGVMMRDGQLNPALPVFMMFARISPAVAPPRAYAEIANIAQQTATLNPFPQVQSDAAVRTTVLPLVDAAASVRDRGSLIRFLQVLVGVVALTLLLACMNVANLLIVRGRERARELAVRAALGASAQRLVQQLVIESVMLAASGAVIGMAVAYAIVQSFAAFTLPGSITLDRLNLGLNTRVLLFTCATTMVTAILFGLLPALRTARQTITDVLREQQEGRGSRRKRGVLIGVQVAISLVLVVGSGLFLRSVKAGLDADVGFDPRAIAAVSMSPKFDGKYQDHLRQYEAVAADIRTARGVASAAVATHVPLSRFLTRPFTAGVAPEGTLATSRPVITGVNHVSNEYFEVLGARMTQGRGFNAEDRPGATRAVILNETAARELWPGESPIGQTVQSPWFGPILFTYVVVGVVRDMKYGSLQEDHVAFAYIPLAQEEPSGQGVTFLTRSTDPRATLPMMQRVIKTIAPDLRISGSRTTGPAARVLSDQIVAALAPQRLGAMLLTGFALLALVVSAVGIYGTVAYAVARRTTEIGIRMALGASSANVVSIVLSDTGLAVGAGCIAGVGAAVVASQLVEHLLYGIGSLDLLAFVSAVAVTAVMAAAAALVPSRRAVRIDPVRAIRSLT